MKKEQIVNQLIQMRSQIDDLLKELSYEDNKKFSEMPISHRLLFVLREMELDNATPIEFVTKVSRSEFKRFRNIGPKTVKEMIEVINKVGLNW